MRRVVKFYASSGRDRRALLEAILFLSLARLMLILPFRWIAPMIGQPEAGAYKVTTVLNPNEREWATATRIALLRAARSLPWNSSCLVSAIAGKLMLRRHRLPSILQLGARAEPGVELTAHAWLRCGEVDIVGAEIASDFTPLVAFKT
jgi:hypothetical protein